MVQLYLHFFMGLHGVMLNELRAGATLNFLTVAFRVLRPCIIEAGHKDLRVLFATIFRIKVCVRLLSDYSYVQRLHEGWLILSKGRENGARRREIGTMNVNSRIRPDLNKLVSILKIKA
jgi:hypothetical protein